MSGTYLLTFTMYICTYVPTHRDVHMYINTYYAYKHVHSTQDCKLHSLICIKIRLKIL